MDVLLVIVAIWIVIEVICALLKTPHTDDDGIGMDDRRSSYDTFMTASVWLIAWRVIKVICAGFILVILVIVGFVFVMQIIRSMDG